MAGFKFGWGSCVPVLVLVLLVLPNQAAAFGAGNIPSIAQVEGHNWRHGDIEDVLKTIAFLHGKKWSTLLIARTYFGNWLRDYSQAVDVGSLKGVNAATIRILVWVLSFLANGYATEEFEVTEERLGVYRPEEHIDNPLGYADGQDARKYDARLRGPVDARELEIDRRTGMKNYIANESGGWATSAGYLRFSFARSIHYGRLYTSGSSGSSGKEADLCEALRCLGQALHCMEDFSAHSNYCELALRELGHHEVYPHCGTATEINLHGKRVYPVVTGTFGAVDFLHSVLGYLFTLSGSDGHKTGWADFRHREANDHFTQSEVDEMNVALKNAERSSQGCGSKSKSLFAIQLPFGGGGDFVSLLSKLPAVGDGFASQARDLKAVSEAQELENKRYGHEQSTRAGNNANMVPGMSPNLDPVKVAKQIYPILAFRDRIVKSINGAIAKIPGLESMIEHITETLTAFILGLLAPFIRPIIEQVSKALKDGSSGVISSSENSQLEPWRNARCDNPTHSMLSKDHFTNILNPCAGRVAASILQYVVPRVLYAWENVGVPVDEVVNDVLRAFHHPAIRDEGIEVQKIMFETVRSWANETAHRHQLNHLLSSESVKHGKNHVLSSGSGSGTGARSGGGCGHGMQGHGKPAASLWSQVKTRDADAATGSGHHPGAQASHGVPCGNEPIPPGGAAASYLSGAPEPGRPNHQQGHDGYGSQQAPTYGPPSGYPGQQIYGQQPPSAGHWQAGSPPQPGYGVGPSQPQYPPTQQPAYPPYPPYPSHPWGGPGYQ